MKSWLKIPAASLLLVSACALALPAEQTAGPEPDFESRSFDDPALKTFLEKNLRGPLPAWPLSSWDIKDLTLAAFFYSPDLDIARAKWDAAKAGAVTAGQRPEPAASAVPQYNANAAAGASPWTLTFSLDLPLETAHKRGYRVSGADRRSEAARLGLAGTAWRAHYRVLSALIDLYKADRARALLARQAALQEAIANIYDDRLARGELSPIVVTPARLALEEARLSLLDMQRRSAEARNLLARSLAMPVAALDKIDVSFDFLESTFALSGVSLPELKRQALTNRADLLALLSAYAAGRAALQLELAKRYPDVHLGPAYSWDQGANKWAFGLTAALPVFNANKGPIKEAAAGGRELESRVGALQTGILGDVELAYYAYQAELNTLKAADRAFSLKTARQQALKARLKPGEATETSLLNADLEALSAQLSRLDAFIKARQALAALEDAVQRPLAPNADWDLRAPALWEKK